VVSFAVALPWQQAGRKKQAGSTTVLQDVSTVPNETQGANSTGRHETNLVCLLSWSGLVSWGHTAEGGEFLPIHLVDESKPI
jgi:hypothetical protein